ncbi:Ig-like domain-containing protein [Variovorax sp. M-6]|uniref:Ig-like domain-containing protein n=1 Tax=Variovorax sp. M-6 TaxID=3233041 RepID=UPI003F99280F
MEAVYKSGGAARQATAEGLVLDRPSIVFLKVAPESVARYERRGGDLVLVLRDGKEIAAPGFFETYADSGRNDLVLEDGAGVLWWGQYTQPWSDFQFTEIEWTDPAAALLPDGVPGWLLGALGVLGIAAAAAGGGGGGGGGGGAGGGGGGAFVPPLLPPQSRAPEGRGEPVATPQDRPVRGQVHASGADGDTLNFAMTRGPEHGTVTIDPATGHYTYVPAPGYEGPDSFEITVSDGRGGSVTVNVPVTVTPVNDAPVAADQAMATNEDTPLTGRVEGHDPDGDTLTYTKGTDPSHGTVTVNPDGSYTYTPAPNFHGTDSFTVAVDDGHGGTTISTVTVTVNPVNDLVSAADDSYTVPEDGTVALDLLANDSAADGGAHVVSINGVALTGGVQTIGVDHGSVHVAADGSLSFVPDADYNGPVSFGYVVADADGDTATATVGIDVTPVNDPPAVAPPNLVTTQEDHSVTGQIQAHDVDGDALSYAIADGGGPAHGTVTIGTNGSFNYVPAADYSGPDSFRVTVTDGQGGATTVTVPVIVTPVTDDVKIVQNVEFDIQGTQFTTYTWSNISTVTDGATTYNLIENGGDGANSDTLVHAIDYLYANDIASATVGQTSTLQNSNLPTQQAQLITGYVYLEAGKAYAFTGKVDDSGTIVIGDDATGHASWGGVDAGGTGSTFTVGASGFYTFDLYLHNASGVGNYDFKVTEQGGGPVQMFGSLAEIQNAIAPYDYLGLSAFQDGADADGNGFYSLEYGFNGAAGSQIGFTGIDVSATDRDGSEHLSMTLTGLGTGATLTYTSVHADGTTSTGTATADASGVIQVDGTAGTVEFRDISVNLPDAGSHNVTLTATTQEGVDVAKTSTFDFLVNASPALTGFSAQSDTASLPAWADLFGDHASGSLDTLFPPLPKGTAMPAGSSAPDMYSTDAAFHAPLPASPLDDQLHHQAILHA